MYSGKNQYDRPASVNLVQNRDVIWSSEARVTVILLNANGSAETARRRTVGGVVGWARAGKLAANNGRNAINGICGKQHAVRQLYIPS